MREWLERTGRSSSIGRIEILAALDKQRDA